MRISRRLLLLFRLVAMAAALALVSSVALAKRGLVRCAGDGTWHLVACCAGSSHDHDTTADEPACCEHVDVVVSDMSDHALATIATPPVGLATTLFAAARWGTLDGSLANARAPSGPPPPTISVRLSQLSTLLS